MIVKVTTLLPDRFHSFNVFWFALLAVMPTMSIALTNRALVLPFPFCLVTIAFMPFSFRPTSYRCQQGWMHEKSIVTC